MSRSARCEGCGGERLLPHLLPVQDPQSREQFEIVACADCGLGHTSPHPPEIAPYYGEVYYGGRHSFTRAYCALRRLRMLRQVAPDAGRILDAGCGEGTFLAAAIGAGWRGLGVDIGGAADAARARGLDVVGRLEDAAERGPFDAITFWHSLEHFPSPAEALTTARRLLTPEGILLVAVPDAGGLQARLFGRHWFHLDVPRHLYHFDGRSLGRLLERTGFSPLRSWHQELEYDLFGWVQSALNMVASEPNLLFHVLTHRPVRAGLGERALSLALGAAGGLLAVPATAAATLARQGGTLVVASKRSGA